MPQAWNIHYRILVSKMELVCVTSSFRVWRVVDLVDCVNLDLLFGKFLGKHGLYKPYVQPSTNVSFYDKTTRNPRHKQRLIKPANFLEMQGIWELGNTFFVTEPRN